MNLKQLISVTRLLVVAAVPALGGIEESALAASEAPAGAAVVVKSVAPTNYTVMVSASPSSGGKVSGGGTFKAGAVQTVTATPSSGCAFVNWTEDGNVVSTLPSYRFTLATNQALVANFRDTMAPTLTLTSPTPNQRWSNAVFTVKGTAKDNLGVAGVWCLTNGVWAAAGSTNHWTNWWLDVALTPGTNVVRAYAADVTGNQSHAATGRVVYVVSERLTVQTTGPCTMSPNYSNAPLEIGRSYSTTVTPGKGFVLSNWVGTVLGEAALAGGTNKLTFIMQSNLVLQANIIPNPFAPVKGVYNGLFGETNRSQDSAGFFTLTLSDSGSYSGSLKRGADTYPFTGRFDVGGAARQVVARPKTNSWVAGMELDFAAQQLRGWVSNGVSGGWVADLLADRAVFDAKTNPAPQYAGKYTLNIPGGMNQDGSVWLGDGYLTLSVDAGGKATYSGSLADGTAAGPASVAVSGDGNVPVYAPLYGSKGSMWGWLTFDTNQPAMSLGGWLSWIKLPQAAACYPAGLSSEVMAEGTRYTPPTNSMTRVLPITNALLIFEGGNLAAPFTNAVMLTASNKVFDLSLTNKLSLSLTVSNGVFSGSVREPGLMRSNVFKGVLMQDESGGYGYFLETNRSGRVRFQPGANNPTNQLLPFERLQALGNAVNSLYKGTTNLDLATANQTVARFLATQPVVAASGSDGYGAWCQLTDGQLLVIDNEAPDPTLFTSSAARSVPLPKAFQDIPGGDQACIYSAIPWNNYVPLIAGYLQARNYHVTVKTDFALEDLMNLPPCSVLLLQTHSTVGAMPSVFCLYTTTSYADNMLSYAREIGSGKVCAYYHHGSDGDPEDRPVPINMALTSKGLDKWSFTQNSLVVMDSCRSLNPISADMQAAIFAKGASAYAGWTYRGLCGVSAGAVTFLFDRLLGVNTLTPNALGQACVPPIPPKEVPAQRPFDWQAVLADMIHRTPSLGIYYDNKYANMTQFQVQPATSDGFGVLAPSIFRATVSPYAGRLQILGLFGNDPGSDARVVDVAGTPLNVISWTTSITNDSILCDLPLQGAGAVGDLRVRVHNHPSNLATISEYKPTLVYTYTQETLKLVVTFTLRIRADLHVARTKPGAAPEPTEIRYIAADSLSTADYVCSGSRADADVLEEWSGSGTVRPSLSSMDYMTAVGVLDQRTDALKLALAAVATQGLTRRITDLHTGTVTTQTVPIAVGVDTWDGVDPAIGKYIQIDLDALQGSDQKLTIPTNTWNASAAAMRYSDYAPAGTAKLQNAKACTPDPAPIKDDAHAQ